MSSKKILTLIFGLLIATGISSVTARADNGSYVFILVARGNSYWTAMADGIHDTAHTKGIKEVVYNTESSTDAEQQLNICQTAIQSQPKLS